MSEIRLIPPTLTRYEWNALYNHGLEGISSITIRKTGSYCEAIKRYGDGAGTIVFGGSANTGGAVGSNAGDVISKAIASLNSGVVSIKVGLYGCTTPIVGKAGVDLIGESMGPWEDFTKGVVLYYTGGVTDAFVDYLNCRSFNIANIKIWNGTDPGNYTVSGSAVAGIRLGGTGAEADPNAGRTKCCNFTNFSTVNFGIGILGGQYSGGVYSGHGPDDSIFINCYAGVSSIAAVANLSSQTAFFGGTFYTSLVGVVHRAVTTHSPDSAMQFYRTVWSGCDTCIKIVGEGNIRGMSFFGAWMENCATTLIDTTATSGSYIGDFTFYNSMGYVNTGGDSQFNFTGKIVRLLWDGGELYPADATCPIKTGNGGVGAYQQLRIRPVSGAERWYCTDYSSVRGFDAGVLSLCDIPTGLDTTVTGSAWTSSLPDMHIPWRAYTITKATSYFMWDTKSTGAGMRLAYPANTVVSGSSFESGSNGVTEDSGDITTKAKTMDRDGHIVTEVHGNGTTAPYIYRAFIIYEW